jgi:hypothetical protein
MTTASGTGGDGNWVRHSRLRPRARTGTLGTVLGRGDAPGMTIAARSGVIPEHWPRPRTCLQLPVTLQGAHPPGDDVDDQKRGYWRNKYRDDDRFNETVRGCCDHVGWGDARLRPVVYRRESPSPLMRTRTPRAKLRARRRDDDSLLRGEDRAGGSSDRRRVRGPD